MERRLCVPCTHTAAVSALAYQPVRREIITGHEDGRLKFWEGDTGQHTATVQQHRGWIADLFYWSEGKVLFSCSVDGRVMLWSSSNQPYDTVLVGEPVFCMIWVSRKNLLLLGVGRGLCVLKKSGKLTANGLPLLTHRVSWLPGHSGIVRCLASSGNKVYTAGYDKRMIVHEVATLSGEGDLPLKTVYVNTVAHDAGITCLQVAKDTDGSTWVVTGSFDKRVKLWTGDGKLVHNIQCSDTVTGICYVPQTRVLWIAAGTTHPLLYEPKSGDNVTDYVPILNTTTHHRSRESIVQLLKFIPETSEVIGSTKLKEVICWKYNPTCSVCCHQSPSQMHIETLTYTSKVPILIFSGSFNGEMIKWEQLQLNSFLYSQDSMNYKEALLQSLDSDDNTTGLLSHTSSANNGTHTTTDMVTTKMRDSAGRKGDCDGERKKCVSDQKVPPVEQQEKDDILKADYRGFMCSLFVESLDLLVASALDGNICVWGYDQHTVQVLQQMQQEALSITDNMTTDQDITDKESSSVISRVAGFTCLHVLHNHKGCVQALAAVEAWTDGGTYLISGGWDLCLCVWNLSTGSMVTSVVDSVPNTHHQTLSNLIITSMAYSPHRKEFAYATSDGLVFVRQFALNHEELHIVRILNGHHSEVTQVCWNDVSGQWVTGSSDCTLRLWTCDDEGANGEAVSVGDPVSVVCVDQTTGYIVVAVQNTLKVYNTDLELLQVSRGHSDVIRSIIHIPDRKQYISSSWDGTVRVWKAYH